MKKSHYIAGILLGLLTPVAGIFIGLQISTTFGTILAWPLVLMSFLTGIPFGMWSPLLWLVAMILSVIVWTLVVYALSQLGKTRAKDKS